MDRGGPWDFFTSVDRGNRMEFQDKSLTCSDCGQSFIFTAGEQEFYERKGFRETPKRCKPCRETRKMRRADAPATASAGGGGGNGQRSDSRGEADGNRAPRSSGPRELFDATCARCRAPAR